MKRFVWLPLIGTLCLASASLGITALAQETPVAAGAAMGEITGKVMVVNTEKRMLTIRTPEGDFQVIHVPSEVKRLDEIKINDQLTISYLEAVAVDLQKGAGGTPGAVVTRDVERESSQRPAGRIEETMTVTGIVEAIDSAASTVTIRGPQRTVTVNVQDPELLAEVSEGDTVSLTYVSAVAAKVE